MHAGLRGPCCAVAVEIWDGLCQAIQEGHWCPQPYQQGCLGDETAGPDHNAHGDNKACHVLMHPKLWTQEEPVDLSEGVQEEQTVVIGSRDNYRGL